MTRDTRASGLAEVGTLFVGARSVHSNKGPGARAGERSFVGRKCRAAARHFFESWRESAESAARPLWSSVRISVGLAIVYHASDAGKDRIFFLRVPYSVV